MAGADDPREVGDRIARLLEELRRTTSPQTWARVDELMRVVLGLYGSGLTRLVEVASDEGTAADLRARLLADPLLSSLLLLHGLHPLDLRTRIERALERLRSALGSHAGSVELLGIDEQGVARLRLDGASASLVAVVERTLGEVAPEISRLDVEGVRSAAAAQGGALVQLNVNRPQATP